MSIKEFVQNLESKDFYLAVENENLVLRGKKNAPVSKKLQGVADASEIISYIKENKAELIKYLSTVPQGTKKKENVTAIYRLSPMQEGLLFHSLYDKQNSAYREQLTCEFDNLNIDIFSRCWDLLLQRHSILRTGFQVDAFEIPVQCVYADRKMPVEIIDLREMDSVTRDAVMKQQQLQDRNTQLDFRQAPLMKVTLFWLGDTRYIMSWTYHHILIDGWSMHLLINKFLTCYELLATGKEIPAGEEDRYEDFIRYIEKTDKKQEEQYWKNYMQGVDTGTLLPFIDLSRDRNKGVESYCEKTVVFEEEQTKRIQSYAQKHGITVNTVMQGVWSYLLHRYTGLQHVTFGVTASGRPADLPNVEKRIGIYINLIPLHADFSGQQTVIGWLQNIQREQLRAREYHTSIGNIQKWIGVQGDLFDTMITFQNFPVNESATSASIPQLKVSGLQMYEQSTNYPLSIRIALTADTVIQFIYKNSLLSDADLIMINRHFQDILLQITGNTALELKDLRLLSPEEDRDIIASFSAGKRNQHAFVHTSITAYFSEQVAKNPAAIALICGNERLSYGDLDARANRLAHYLIKLGVKEEMLLPVCLQPSAGMIVSILAIMKTGAAYVPVDPGCPAERFTYILRETGARFILADAGTEDILDPDINIISLDTHWLQISMQPDTSPDVHVRPNNLAYVIYTSGSTGMPKGVMIEHQQLLNYVSNGIRMYGAAGAGAGSFLHLSYTFDASLTALFVPLLQGRSLVVGQGNSVNAFEDPALTANAPYDFIKITPAHLPLLESMMGADGVGNLTRKLVIGGEALHAGYLQFLFDAGTDIEIINEYGPTETTVGCTTWSINTATGPTTREGSLPIGKPLDNTVVYIVDVNNSNILCPVGVAGELCIAGEQVGRGYLHQEELTAARFVEDPFAPGRMYRTGDIARWQADGNLAFLGRTDDQLKIKGYRIEPGEVEMQIQQTPGVKQAVVIMREDKHHNPVLIAYVVADEQFDEVLTRELLGRRLPDYMVPAILFRIDEMPLTVNGKIDRKKLPAVDTSLRSLKQYQEPRNETEEKLVLAFQALLEVPKIGISDNFFELGGNSLLAIRLIALIRKQFGKEIAIKEVFDHPDVTSLALRLEQHTDVKQAVITKYPANISMPLSFGQERLWFMYNMQKGTQHQVAWVFRLMGQLKPDALESAFKAIVSRHHILRSVIKEENGIPYQVIKEADLWQMNIINEEDIRGNGAGKVDRYINRMLGYKFDLSEDHMLKVTLIRLVEENSYMLVTQTHHIAFDGWSVGILAAELSALYTAAIKDQTPALPVLPVQYGDFAIWQRSHLSGGLLENKLSYWKQKLHDVAPLELPLDYLRPAIQSYHSANVQWHIGRELLDKLNTLSRSEGATLFMTLLSVFKVLIFRYSGLTDICIGTPVAGRYQEEVETLIGCFVNTIALRTHLDAEQPFRDLLRAVKEVTLSAYEYQDIPFEKIVQALDQERDMSRSPLFQVVFALHNTPRIEPLEMPDVQFFPVIKDHATCAYDLDLDAIESADGLYLSMNYCADLFKAETIHRMLIHYTNLLQAVVEAPDVAIFDLKLSSLLEDHQFALTFNTTKTEYPENESVTDLFSYQVKTTPDAIALVYGERQYTYHELDKESNRLAHLLLAQGVKEGMFVPVCIERSAALIIAIIAVLKTGAVYVPVDPDYPAERISYMLNDVNASVFITTSQYIPAGNVRVINLIEEKEHLLQLPDTPTGVTVNADALAYIMYTSGSTGKPKGVMVEHGNIVSLVKGVSYVDLSPDTTLLSTGSPSFDATTIEYWGTLLNGGRLVMCSQQDLLDVTSLEEMITKEHVNTMWLTSGWFGQVIEADITVFSHLSTIMVGGDRLPPSHIDRVKRYYPDLKVINGYGPTENTTFSLTYEVPQMQGLREIPIGRPLSNRIAYVLDAYHRLCPLGIAGELYVGGAGLSRGYLNQPELTAEKFTGISFDGGEEVRLYRTGDMARWMEDGNIAFLGRKDSQVKIRGYRIELGEVEQMIEQLPDVSQAVVVVLKNDMGQQQLVGYVVTGGEVFQSTEAVAVLKERLPAYMVPVVIYKVPEIPLTGNGKVDRKALPALALRNTFIVEYEAPRNALEEAIAAIWARLLDLEKVGVNNNYFDLGGHSLLAVRILSSIRNELAKEVTIRDIFEFPTVAKLAERIEETNNGVLLPVIQPGAHNGKMKLSYGQERLWFIDKLTGSVQYHMPWVFRLHGDLDADVVEASFREIINRHQVLRSVITEEEGNVMQSLMPVSNWKMLRLNEEELTCGLDEYICGLIAQPFNLAEDFMIRLTLLKISDKEHVLAIILHHIVFDGWSIGIMVNELVELYKASMENRPAVLPELRVQYADYAHWQRTYLSEEVLTGKLSYWKEQLSGIRPLSLFTDFPRPAVQSIRGGIARRRLDKELSERLTALSAKEGATLFMTMLAAFKIVLYRYSGQSDISVGSMVAGRQQKEVENLIGFFINTLALRTNVKEQASFTELLQEVKEVTLAAYEHQDVPFEKVVEVLGIERDLGRTPLFQVTFTLQNMPEGDDLNLGTVEVTDNASGEITSKFDLNVEVTEAPEGLYLLLTYCSDLYRSETIERLLDHYENVLEAVVANANKSIGSLTILEPEETYQLLSVRKGPELILPGNNNILDLFEAQVQATPDAPAIIFGEERLTYAELDAAANRVAHFLQKMGVKEEMLVPLCLRRSVNLITGILGILKAGGAYVPLDPDYPAARLEYILKDTDARFVLADAFTEEFLPDGVTVISFDTYWSQISLQPSGVPSRNVSDRTLAYVIYTSGSTGIPKGMMIEHRQLLNYALNGLALYGGKGEGAGSFMHLSYTFDASLTALFVPLLGGRLLVLGRGEGIEAFEDPALTEHAPYDFIKLTPGHLSVLDALVGAEGLRALTGKIIAGGEALHTRHVQFLADAGLDMEVINEYGPTETTVGCSIYRFNTNAVLPLTDGSLPIGTALANTSLYVVDINNPEVLCPPGAEGELCIGGSQVGRGYLGQPGQTVAKFLTDPFSKGSGARMYRTGDKVRWLLDGNLAFLGRIDEQVKINGYRIEPGEIVYCLLKVDDVKDAVIIIHAEKLYAYIQIEEEKYPDLTRTGMLISRAMAFVAEQLPSYLHPAGIIPVHKYPLTSHGKTDKKTLVRLYPPGMLKSEHTGPANSTEEMLAVIWQDLLGLDQVGVLDNFFSLGGHSLSMVQMLSRLREYGIELTLKELFNAQTVRDQSALIHTLKPEIQHPHLIQLNNVTGGAPVFILPGSIGLSDDYEELAAHFVHCPVYGIQMEGIYPGEKPLDNIADIASLNIERIRKVQAVGPYRFIGHSFGAHVAFEMGRQLETAGEIVGWIALLDVAADMKAGNITTGIVMQTAADVFSAHRLLNEEYLNWGDKLEAELKELSIGQIVPHIRAFLKTVSPAPANIDHLLNQLDVRIHNMFITYHPQQKISAPLIIAPASATRLKENDYLEWVSYSTESEVVILPGNHFTVVKGKGATSLHKFLTEKN
ncbi:amino acid adenylation domain-containing protein [Chitinophaga oryziterrae]|uniref:Amino acid adenylation domain-containing protein n=1 Tax=Chitinophaga oryziterrae TaxID=1031224 RepID=A0A6N8JCF1_9BACT|nr:non-ribosomal peptide synthetase [Chitinophaga oryziterrae]MVT42873.1 amino acid adenylation domain-containing protein [Chitinophaga oryziterrae]